MKINRWLANVACAGALFLPALANAAPVVSVGGYDKVSNYSNSGAIGGVLANAANTALFGASFTYQASVAHGGLTQAYLDSIDIFWSGLPGYGALTAGEVVLLTDWVNAGGVVIINNDRTYTSGFRDFDAFLTGFGIQLLDESSPASIVNPTGTHAILNGPFGAVGSFNLVDAAKLSTSGSATMLMDWSNGFGASAIADRTAGRNGAVIVLPDWEDTAVCLGCMSGGINGPNLAKNTWAYAASIATSDAAAVPEPLSLTLVAIGLLGLGVARRRI
jgi:hypothetical protein